MEKYKDCLLELRKITLKEVHLIITDDVLPQLVEYVISLGKVKLEDGAYHKYYGEIKKYIVGFFNFYCSSIDHVIQEADKYSNIKSKQELLTLMRKTVEDNHERQVYFCKNYLPVHNSTEKKEYEKIENTFEQYRIGLDELYNKIEKLDKLDKVENFSKTHFSISVEKTREIFEFAHNYIAMMMADRVKEIKISMEEILLRNQNNFKTIRDECLTTVNSLLLELYDKNKELLNISRTLRRCSTETAEVCYSMSLLRDKITDYRYEDTFNRIEEESEYWKNRLQEFTLIADNLQKLIAQQKQLADQEKDYRKKVAEAELRGSYAYCQPYCGTVKYNVQNKRKFLKDNITTVARSLITFFSIKGCDHVMHKDDIGTYYIDEFNHQTYVFNHGSKLFHLTNEGQFQEVDENEKYFFDINGRYVIDENGDRNYQCAPCTSSYRLGKHDIERVKEDRNVSLKAREFAVLPPNDSMDIKGTLDTETVKYLWKSFGYILPNALHDVGNRRPKNPIHYLAHKILLHKYNKTIPERLNLKREAKCYRNNILKEREENAIKASKAWKAKQSKRSKPNYDDHEDSVALDAYAAERNRVIELNYYND